MHSGVRLGEFLMITTASRHLLVTRLVVMDKRVQGLKMGSLAQKLLISRVFLSTAFIAGGTLCFARLNLYTSVSFLDKRHSYIQLYKYVPKYQQKYGPKIQTISLCKKNAKMEKVH